MTTCHSFEDITLESSQNTSKYEPRNTKWGDNDPKLGWARPVKPGNVLRTGNIHQAGSK
jgi:hypothetical protein